MFSLHEKSIRLDGTGKPFSTEAEFSALADADELSRQDLEAIWNSFAAAPPCEAMHGMKPVKKFRNRPYGIQQIWKVIQPMAPADELVPVRKTKAQRAAESNGFRPDSKAAQALKMIRREGGASLVDLMEALDWQRHTVRGFVSTLGSKHGVKVAAERDESKGVVYRA